MKRLLSACIAAVLVFVLCAVPASAVIRPRNDALFTSSDPVAAMAELGASLSMTVTDNTVAGVTLEELQMLETAVNYLSADLVREAVGRMNSQYGIVPEIIFIPYSGQSYVGLTSLVVNRDSAYCTIELVDMAPSGITGLKVDTMLHELCHLVNFSILDEQAANPVSPLFAALNGELYYQVDYPGPMMWRNYIASLGEVRNAYFVSDYAMTDPFEDFACLLQAVAQNSDLWEIQLLQENYAPLLAKYDAAMGVLEQSFTSGGASPLLDLFPAQWAVAEWQEAKTLGLVPEALDCSYDSPITRLEFSLLMVELLRALWGTEPAGLLTAQGFDLTVSPFPDTLDENATLLYTLGVVEGREDGRFDPDAPITRQEAAKLLYLTAQAAGLVLPDGESAVFTDEVDISTWATDYVAGLCAAGVMNGTGDGAFSPKALYDRQQSFLTVLRLYHLAAVAQTV